MRASRKAAAVAVAAALCAFGYSQYAAASQIGVELAGSRLLGEEGGAASYGLELEFDNPSLLVLAAGRTEFAVTAGGDRVGGGTLEPFVLPAMGTASVSGTYVSERGGEPRDVVISGVTSYDLPLGSVDVPFEYRPTGGQASEFIRSG